MMNPESKRQIQIMDDLATGGWFLLKWTSVGLVPLIFAAGLLNYAEPDIGFQILAGLGALLAINAFFFGMHRLFRHWRRAIDRY